MENDTFHVDEYLSLWESHGIDVLAPHRERLLATPERRGCAQCGATALRADGDRNARLAVLGDAADGDEAALLGKILEAMGTSRDRVLLVAAPSCPGCVPLLHATLDGTEVVVTLGAAATQLLVGAADRGRLLPYPGKPHRFVMATHALSQLLKHPASKRETWDDLKQVMAKLGEKH